MNGRVSPPGWFGIPFLGLVLLLLAACGANESPERQLRAWVASAEAAAESRSLLEFKRLISARYQDLAGHSRRDLVRLAAGHLLGHRAIHLLTQIQRVALNEPGQAQLTLVVAMAGRPFPDLEDRSGFRADIYRFDLELALEGDGWRLTHGSWRRVEWSDFLE